MMTAPRTPRAVSATISAKPVSIMIGSKAVSEPSAVNVAALSTTTPAFFIAM